MEGSLGGGGSALRSLAEKVRVKITVQNPPLAVGESTEESQMRWLFRCWDGGRLRSVGGSRSRKLCLSDMVT
jgi:hypothetical protein